MEKNIRFTPINTTVATLTTVVFYSVFKTKTVADLSEDLDTRPVLARAIASKNSHSYNRTCIYVSIALAAYIVIAIGNDVEIDMDLAITSLVILFAIALARLWFLRRLLSKP